MDHSPDLVKDALKRPITTAPPSITTTHHDGGLPPPLSYTLTNDDPPLPSMHTQRLRQNLRDRRLFQNNVWTKWEAVQLADNLEAKQNMEKIEWKYWKEVEKQYEQLVLLPLLLSDSDDDGQNEAHQYAWQCVKKRLNADPLQIAKEMVMLSPFLSLSPQQLVSHTKDSNQ